ncbi:MAG: HAMP domain-containing histidine kinase [Bacteroidales bacterium]|nr:HAMP domain-containing histidine kinase [Bacteroidales bacterium]
MLNVNIGNVYIMKENYTKAYEYCNKAYRSSLIDDMPKSKAAVLINLGEIHSHLGNVDTAYYFTDRGLTLARKHDYLDFKSGAFETLTRIDSLRGNYLSALAYKDSLMKVEDKIWDQQLNDKIAELNVEHEVEKQKKANKLLKQKAELDQQHIRTQRILIIALGVALLFIVYVGLRLQRKKSKLQSLNELLNKKNKELADSYEELKKLNATKDKFFSIIAHDLKGPIGTQSEMLNELLEDYDNVDKEELYIYLKNLRKNGDNSYTLLLNLLDWSRTQQGRIENNPETMKVKDMVVDVYELLKPRAERKRQELINNFENDELFAFADKSLTNRVLYNLINNAIKFTPSGKQIRIDGRKNGDNIEIDITDEGIGIPREKIDTLFGLNNEIKRKGTEDESGTGLGLMLCKEFADLIGGEIDVKSKEGEGSTFTFILPAVSHKAGKEKNVQGA